MTLCELRAGEPFRLVGPCRLSGRVVLVTACAVTVDVDRPANVRTFETYDGKSVSFEAPRQRVTWSRATEVERPS